MGGTLKCKKRRAKIFVFWLEKTPKFRKKLIFPQKPLKYFPISPPKKKKLNKGGGGGEFLKKGPEIWGGVFFFIIFFDNFFMEK